MTTKRYTHKPTGTVYTQVYNSPTCLKDGYYKLNDIANGNAFSIGVEAFIVETGNDWEEIKENGYEILSFITGAFALAGCNYRPSCYVHYKPGPEYDHSKRGGDYYWFLDGGGREYEPKIHSVKRLSDDAIFTLGDKIITQDGSNIYITEFIKDPNGEFGIFVRLTNKTINRQCTLRTLEQRKKVFTSDDGVEMFEGDPYWYVFKTGGGPWTMGTSAKLREPIIVKSKSRYPISKWVKRFASHENAIKFLDEHTVLFTTEDNVQVFKGNIVWYASGHGAGFGKVVAESINEYDFLKDKKFFFSEEKLHEWIWKNAKVLSWNDITKAIWPFNSTDENKIKEVVKSRL